MDPDTLRLLARSVSRELRQPLTVILGYAELLETRAVPAAERAARLAEIRRAAARLAGSLDRLDRVGRRPAEAAVIRVGPGDGCEVIDLRPEPD